MINNPKLNDLAKNGILGREVVKEDGFLDLFFGFMIGNAKIKRSVAPVALPNVLHPEAMVLNLQITVLIISRNNF